MFTLGNADSIVGLMTVVLAYFFVVTISGYFRAWVAVKMGDETPEYMGFLSVSPLKHTDPVGFFVLIFLGFGWGRYIPIMPFNISGKYRKLKLFLANFSDVFANLCVAVICLMGLVIYLGKYVLNIALPMMLLPSGDTVFFSLIQSINMLKTTLVMLHPTSSSFAIAMVLVTIAIMYLSVLLAVLNFIINSLGFLYLRFKDKIFFLGRYGVLFVILVSMLLVYLLVNRLRLLVALGIMNFVSILVKIFGFY